MSFVHPYEFMNSEVVTLAYCWKLIRTDGTVMGFTSHDANLTFDGVTYQAESGITPSAVAASENLSTDNLDILGILSSNSITAVDIEAGLYDFAELLLYVVDWTNATGQKYILKRGKLGKIKYDKGSYTAEVRGLAEAFSQTSNKEYQKTCRATLGDEKCGINLANYTFSETVTTLNDSVSCYTDLLQADGFFNYGFLTWSTGNNAKLLAEVRYFAHTNGYVEFFIPVPFNIQVGDTFTITAGCDRNYSTCVNRFNNRYNYRGEPMVPGTDYLTNYPVTGSANTVNSGSNPSRYAGWVF